MNPTATTGHVPSPGARLLTQAERDAEQTRVNGLDGGGVPALRAEILEAAVRAHAAHPRYEGDLERWFLGRMTEDDASGVLAGDLVLYVPTAGDPHGRPFTVYAIRTGIDLRLPAGRAGALERAVQEPPRVEGAPGNPALVSNVSVDGVIVGSVTRLAEDSFVATAYPTRAGSEYTVGGRRTIEGAVAAVHAEFEAGWASC